MKNSSLSLVIRQLEGLRCCFNSFFYQKKHEKKENDRKTQLAKDNLLPSMAFPVELICVLQRIMTNTFLVRNLDEDEILKIMSSLSVRHQAFPDFTCFFFFLTKLPERLHTTFHTGAMRKWLKMRWLRAFGGAVFFPFSGSSGNTKKL